MNKKEKTPVPLKHSSPYTLLVAVLLSAQCTDERVNKVTPVLFKKADNPKDMMGLSYDDVYSIIKPCGLGPKKARAIISLSKTLTETSQSPPSHRSAWTRREGTLFRTTLQETTPL